MRTTIVCWKKETKILFLRIQTQYLHHVSGNILTPRNNISFKLWKKIWFEPQKHMLKIGKVFRVPSQSVAGVPFSCCNGGPASVWHGSNSFAASLLWDGRPLPAMLWTAHWMSLGHWLFISGVCPAHPKMYSIGFKSGEREVQGRVLILLVVKKAVVSRAVWGLALSCWNTVLGVAIRGRTCGCTMSWTYHCIVWWLCTALDGSCKCCWCPPPPPWCCHHHGKVPHIHSSAGSVLNPLIHSPPPVMLLNKETGLIGKPYASLIAP
jgi:hypothetical protein